MDTQPPIPETISGGKRPRKPFLLTGKRLGNKVQLAEVLLRSGASQLKVAKDLSISVRSVGEIARRMGKAPSQTITALSGTPVNPTVPVPDSVQSGFDDYVKGDLQRVARLSLGNITAEKAKKATIRDLGFVADKSLARLEAIESRSSNMQAFAQIYSSLGIAQSHSASRMTLEQKITVETSQTTFVPPPETT
ncbi:MAG TPA: hypothetical protein VJT11_01820 [Nitrospiraceae bacterium]|nr:hypothetical protein [Nitrospiraceae bacterium]